MLVQAPLPNVPGHIQGPFGPGSVWVYTDRRGAIQTAFLTVTAGRIPVGTPRINVGGIAAGSRLLPLPFGGESYNFV